MHISSLLTEKKKNNLIIKSTYWLLQKYKPLWLIRISDQSIRNNLIEWLKFINAWFVVISQWEENILVSKNIAIVNWVDDSMLSWFDFVVSDDNIEKISDYLWVWIAPIIIRDNHLSNILKEFNPMKNEWNAYFYDEKNHWSITYSVIRYIENYKFPFDNKNLIKNVISI